MYDNHYERKTSQADREILMTLNAISIVSGRLANRIKRAMTTMEGGKSNGTNERNECVYQRAARLCRDFD